MENQNMIQVANQLVASARPGVTILLQFQDNRGATLNFYQNGGQPAALQVQHPVNEAVSATSNLNEADSTNAATVRSQAEKRVENGGQNGGGEVNGTTRNNSPSLVPVESKGGNGGENGEARIGETRQQNSDQLSPIEDGQRQESGQEGAVLQDVPAAQVAVSDPPISSGAAPITSEAEMEMIPSDSSEVHSLPAPVLHDDQTGHDTPPAHNEAAHAEIGAQIDGNGSDGQNELQEEIEDNIARNEPEAASVDATAGEVGEDVGEEQADIVENQVANAMKEVAIKSEFERTLEEEDRKSPVSVIDFLVKREHLRHQREMSGSVDGAHEPSVSPPIEIKPTRRCKRERARSPSAVIPSTSGAADGKRRRVKPENKGIGSNFNGHFLFKREKGWKDVKVASAKWKKLSEEEKKEYNERAKEMKKTHGL